VSAGPITLRVLSPEEWPLFRELRQHALRDAPYAFGSTIADWQGERDNEQRWRQRLTDVPFNVIAYLDGVPAGMGSGTNPNAQREIDLISMWVAPFARGNGVAGAIVDAVVEWAQRRHVDAVCLDVMESNERAMVFYRRCGFVDRGPVEEAVVASPKRRMSRERAR
jgi:RimJ/RimL family protein N-acetyltransferase